jgi:hypothetical protein
VYKRTGDHFYFYSTDVFAVPKISTGLAYIGFVAYFTYQLVYAAFVVVLCCVVSFGFGQLS